MNPLHLTKRLARLMRSAGVSGFQPSHAFRHSMATALIADGADIKSISQGLGHSSARITLDVYVHGEEKRDRAASDAMAARLETLKNAAEMPQDIARTRGKP